MKGLIVFILALFLLLLNLDKPEIYILDEAKNAECAREMLVNNNFIIPYFNGQIRTDKPPLHYFFMALSYKMFGVSAFSARFFSAVFGALTILITFLFTRRYFNERIAWLSALVLLSSLHFNFQMRLSVPDPYLIFFMTSAFMTFYAFSAEGNKKWLWLMYISFGLGLLTKGPVAIALPGLIALIFLILSKQFSWKFVASMHMPLGGLIVLAIALPWYWLNYEATNGLWTEGFFLKHNLQRFSDTMEGHGGFFLLPLIMVMIGLLPLGVFCVQALFFAWKERADTGLLYCLCIVLGIILFFSFSQTKLPNYTAPAYPFIAIMIAFLLNGMEKRAGSLKSVKWAYVVYTIIAFALPAAVYFGLSADKNVASVAGVWIWFLPIHAGSILGWYFMNKRKMGEFILSMSLSFIISNILFFAKAYPTVYASNPVVSSIPILQKKSDLVYYKMMNSAYVFNMKRIIPVIHSQDSLKTYLKTHPEAAVISRKQFDEEIRSATELVPVFEQKDTFEKPTTIIYELKK